MLAPLAAPSAAAETSPRTAFALAAFYFAWLGALGLFFPYLGVYFRSLGFSDAEASRLLAVLPAASLLAPPLLGLLADARHARPWLLRGATALSALGFAGVLLAPRRFLPTAALLALFALARSPIGALTDAAAAECRDLGFGRLRLWGSLGFLLAAVGSGPILDRFGMGATALGSVAGLAIAAAVAWALPAARVERHPEALLAWRTMLRDRTTARFLAAIAVTQVAGASYDAGFSLHLARLGCSKSFMGVAWGIGVAAEIAVLAYSDRLLRRFAPARLLAFAIGVAALRWALVAAIRSPAWLLLLQPLHGITFAVWFVAAVQVARRRGGAAPTAGQGLLSAASAAGLVVGMSVAGRLLELGGGRLLYGCAAGVAVVGAGLALSHAGAEAREDEAAASVPPLSQAGSAVG